MNGRPVLIEWEDASVEDVGPWVDQENARPMPVKVFKQVGFLLEDTPECLVLTCAMERLGSGLMASRERIPRGMVRSIVDLVPDAPKPTARGKRKTA